jgi:hypothetical protein
MKNVLFRFCVLLFVVTAVFQTACADQPIIADLDTEYTNEFYVIKTQSHPDNSKLTEQVYRPDSLTLDTDRDPADVIFRRTEALARDIETLPGSPDLKELKGRLDDFGARVKKTNVKDIAVRLKLFKDIAYVRREITLSNPLLDFSKILLVKSRLANNWHCCDQYFGKNFSPGGGVYLLSDVLGDEPKLTDILANAVVQNGRLKGQKLEGSFLSPELSFDGRKFCLHIQAAKIRTGRLAGVFTSFASMLTEPISDN